ncbi:MarR family winged helix-turn-helix transcriptional regulator [Dongia sp.]|uniref:MarR family winged helix-turn-helix transcriptional regulator n=1 Tax=Dongia sp. TaxID=1977262 RepID=UPI0035B3E0DE
MDQKPRTERPGDPQDALQLSKQLCFAVYSTAHAFNRAYKPLLAPLDLTYPQYLVMLVLWQQDDLTVKEIGAQLQLDSGTLTPLLKRMAGARLIERIRDSGDERQVRIKLTAKGAALRERARDIPLQVADALGRSLPEISALRQQLSALRDTLEANVA